MTPFDQFLTSLRADARLGKYLRAPTPITSAETIIRQLCLALADATEGTRPHPAHLLLKEIDRPTPRAIRPPLALRGRVGFGLRA